MLTRRFVQGLALVAGISALPARAHAETNDPAALKLACVQASDRAQQLRVAGKLVAARDALKVCVVDGCPSVVREACSQWLGEVNASLPSIVIGAQDSDGKDVLDVKVSIDGQLVTEHLGGRALPIDPGRHKMRYEKPDGTVKEEEILVGEGAKNKQVSVVFPGPKAAVGAPPASPAAPITTTRVASTANTAIGTVLAVVGAGALGTALYLDLSTTSNVNTLKNTCGKTGMCNPSTVSGYELDYDLAGVSLGVGIVAVGFAAYVFIAHPFGTLVASDAKASEAPASRFRVVPSPHGGGFAVTF
jgi:hypothetical protein